MDTASKDLQNRYRILQILGQGGMGAVYLCEDLRLPGKQWAVKEMLCPESLPFAARETFEREVRILAGLRHRNLPMIVDYFHEEHGSQYLVMEYVEGRTLYDEIKERGPADEVQALRWGLEIARLLDYLHTREPPVIFRDLKPENIMVSGNRSLKLIDFGLARHFDPGKATDTHASGSVGYAPPEQWDEEGQTDARSDVYSLGATLYFMLSGQVPSPVYGSNRLGDHRNDLDPELIALVQRCLELDPERRYQSAARVVHELFLLLSRKLPSGELGLPPPITRLIPPKPPEPQPVAHVVGPAPPLKKPELPRWLGLLLLISTITFLLAAGLSRLPAVRQPASPTPDTGVVEKARALASQGQAHRAIALLDERLVRHPEDADAHILKQNLYAQLTARRVVHIPVVTSLSGLDGSEGYPMLYGVALAQKQINDFGGIDRRPLVVDVFDDGSDPDRGHRVAEQIAGNPEYLVAVGPFSSQRALNMAPVFSKANLTLLAPTASDPRLWESGPYLMTAADTNLARIRALAAHFYGKGMKKAAMLVDESLILSYSYSQAFLAAFEELGGQVVAVVPYTGTTRDFAAQVAAARERSPDFLFLCDYRVAKVVMLEKELHNVGWRVPVATQVALYAPGLEDFQDIYTASYFHPAAEDARSREFVADYRQTFGLDFPSHVPSSSYDAMQIAAEAIRVAGTSRQSVNQFLTSIGGTRPPYAGVTGRFGLGRKLDLRTAYVVEIRNGNYQLIQEVPAAR